MYLYLQRQRIGYKPVSVWMDSLLDDRSKMDMLHMNNHKTIHKNDSPNQNLCQKEQKNEYFFYRYVQWGWGWEVVLNF